ncbi:TOTE conflict system archaeo-eukaryotic primase domain-containing protein [Prevotella intermedia]|uniref:TOTE conflict system archaeo-eukaryotic primase domain-containing protein n=1 Tax=Prevotella intermedia TaxID=28131 RepID=UPI000A446943|nr:DEAD/DEAH box helicase family protein [Prevotella intermedia]
MIASMDMTDFIALKVRVKELEEENSRLKEILDLHGIEYKCKNNPEESETLEAKHAPTSDRKLSLQEKVAIFQELFQGRNDVFAKRWYSRTTQKSGYQPVCENEWKREYCDKRKYKCADCPNRQFAPLSYSYLFNHLAGKDEWGRDVIGIYPIRKDNTCSFLCTDFDDKSCEHGYKNDVIAFVKVCKEWSVPCYIERSRSGNGIHVWIFFKEPILASKARKLGNAILTEAMSKDIHLSFKSYDRFFPNQDTLPDGGLGNLVALPLQGKARRKGNSVFVDESFNAYTNQWDVLAHIRKISEVEIDLLLQEHTVPPLGELSKTSESKPWETPRIEYIGSDDFPKNIVLTRANMLYIPLAGLSAKCVNTFKRMAAFRNPEFYEKQGMRLSTHNIPRVISCSELYDEYLALPRGCEDSVFNLLAKHGVQISISDQTNHGQNIDVSFKGELREEQQSAMEAIFRYNIGTLSATTAFGKTVFAIAMIAKRKVNTLILVHNKALLEQWKERLGEFLEVRNVIEERFGKRGRKKRDSIIGCLYSGRNTLHGIVDIALMQSCLKANEVKTFVKDYGMVIVDECHHVSSVSFEQVLRQVKATYVYGLTATPIRKDGHQPIIFMQCGQIRFTSASKEQIAKHAFKRTLIPRFTTYCNITDRIQNYTQITESLSNDKARNELIVEDIKTALQHGRTPLVLTTRTAHVKVLAQMLLPFADNVIQLIGADSMKEKSLALQKLQSVNQSETLIIVATGKYIGEGFDYPRLDTLFLTLPISWKGNIEQYAGRLHREYKGKNEVYIYDYVDIRVSLCDSMYRKRLKGYIAAGYGKKGNSCTQEGELSNLIYTRDNYERTFQKDLIAAKHTVVIAVPRIRYKYKPLIIETLNSLLHMGIGISVRIKENGYNETDLANMGIDVVCNNEQTLQCAIIDKSIVWYGNINFFGFNSETSNIMRIVDHKIANEMIGILYSHTSKCIKL